MNHLPPLHVVASDGRPLVVHLGGTADTIGDLARELGWAGASALLVAGSPVASSERLVDVPMLRHGVDIARGGAAAPSPPGGPASTATTVEVAVVAGPACRGWAPLPPGNHRVGSARHCTVRLADPLVELHHGAFDVGDDVRFTQLTGRVPALVAGRPCVGPEVVRAGDVVTIGASALAIRSRSPRPAPSNADVGRGSLAPGPDPWRSTVRRGPTPPEPAAEEPIAVPPAPAEHPSPPITGLVGGGVAAVAAVVAASVLGHAGFAVFAVIGALASIVTWVVGAAVAARRRRAGRRAHRAAQAEFRVDVAAAADRCIAAWRRANPGVVEMIDEVAEPRGRVWERRVADERRVRATIGTGSVTLALSIAHHPDGLPPELASHLARHSTVDGEPSVVELAAGSATALHGTRSDTMALARSIVAQVAAWYGPADWGLVVVACDPQVWRWAAWLPHVDGGASIVAASEVERLDPPIGSDRLVVVVTDEPRLFDSRTGPFRRFLDASESAVLALVPLEQSVPARCTRTLVLGPSGTARWSDGSPTDDRPGRIRIAGLDEPEAASVARRLASLHDPETAGVVHEAPAVVTYAQLHADHPAVSAGRPVATIDAATIERYWRSGGADPAPCTPIGISADGVVEIDLVRDGPHGLIAGTTGSGKSELLRTLVVGLATRVGPDHITFVLVDYKGGATFDACERLPHTVGVVTDLDDGAAERALVSLDAELRRRERVLREVGAGDLTEFRRRSDRPLPRLVVVVDEFAALAKELPDFLPALVGIAQRGRSLGVHLLLATQRPAGVVSDDIRANTNLRMALRLHDATDARDVVGDDLPASLPRGLAGRAVLRLGPDELVVFQSGRCTGRPLTGPSGLRVERLGGPDGEPRADSLSTESSTSAAPTQLDHAVDAIRVAADRQSVDPPHRPWCDPLPDVLRSADVAALTEADDAPHDAVGIVDAPAAQAQRPLRWRPGAGNLALVGPLGSGTTSALVAVAVASCRTAGPDDRHLYVVDANGDSTLDQLRAVAHCAGVVRPIEIEPVHRLLRRLAIEIDERVAGGAARPDVVLAIDGYPSLRSALAERWETAELLDRVLAEGPAVGVASVLTSAEEPTLASLGDRWRFVGPPGRVCVASTGLDAQLAIDPPVTDLPARVAGEGPAGIDVLPDVVCTSELRPSVRVDGPANSAHRLVVGRSADHLDDAVLTVAAGDHVLVAGPSCSGKSTALGTLAAAWRDANPGGRVVVVGRRTPPPPDALEVVDGGRVLLVADDCDRIDDVTGLLAAAVAEHRPDVTIVAAARAEAIRGRYGHWSRELARHRCGLLMASAADVDGDLFGVAVPKRTIVASRPGLAWLIDAGEQRLAQVAMPGGAG